MLLFRVPGFYRLIVAALLQISVALSAQAQEQGRAVLSGRVLDAAGLPIDNAEIAVVDRKVRTNAQGDFKLDKIPAGTHEIRVRHVAYAPQTIPATFSGGDTSVHRITLTRVVALDSVVVTERRSPIPEFDERRARGGGHFITRAELEKWPGRKMADVLRGVPGLRIRTDPRKPGQAFAINSRGVITMRGANPTCYVLTLIDDVAVFSGDTTPFNINSLSAPEIEGIEYYPGGASMPAKYNRTGSACGVLLIWTRRS